MGVVHSSCTHPVAIVQFEIYGAPVLTHSLWALEGTGTLSLVYGFCEIILFSRYANELFCFMSV